MNAITLARLGLLYAFCLLLALGDPDFYFLTPLRAARGILERASIFFLSALPAYVLIIRAEMATAHLSARRRIAILALAVVAGAVLFALTRFGLRFGLETTGGFWELPIGH